jgi:pimeloyl-ACP methyl ester carboxylesterase
MTPLFFGHGQRRLFGLYTPARKTAAGLPAASTRAVVLCPPLGQEYLHAHRSLRQLANLLAAAGYDVLRFDYYGTGDSAGGMNDADLRGWEDDIATAIDELKDTCDAPRVNLVGLRLGATLAAQVAARRARDTQSLVLWDPVVRGATYLEELMRAGGGETPEARAPIPIGPEQGGGHEILGFPITARLQSQLATVDLGALVPSLPKRTLALWTSSTADQAHLASAAVPPAEARLAMEYIEALPAWLNDADSGAGAVPVAVLHRIVQWLT